MRLAPRALAFPAALVPLLTLFACSGDDGQAALTVWSWDGTVEQAVAGFEAENPDIDVAVVNAGSPFDEHMALDNAIQAGSGVPDLVMFEYFAVPYFAIPGKVTDLGEFGAGDLEGDFVPAAWNGPLIQNLVITAALLTIVPLIVAFRCLRRYWRSGLSLGAVKG